MVMTRMIKMDLSIALPSNETLFGKNELITHSTVSIITVRSSVPGSLRGASYWQKYLP